MKTMFTLLVANIWKQRDVDYLQYLEQSLSALIQPVTLEVGPGQVEQHLRVVEVVELTKTIFILWNEEWRMRNEEWMN